MAMNKSGHRPGGGIASNKRVDVGVRTGSGSHSVRPAGTNRFGYSVGDHTTEGPPKGTGYRGEKLHNPERNFQPTTFGNEIAARTVCGPGGSREVQRTGSQGQHGGVAGQRPQQSQDTLAQYGPERTR